MEKELSPFLLYEARRRASYLSQDIEEGDDITYNPKIDTDNDIY